MINPGIFETLNSLTIYAKDRDLQNRLSGILVHDKRNADHAITITAEDGNLGQDNSSILLYLHNGTVQKFNFDTKKSEILKFESYVLNLSDNDQKNRNIQMESAGKIYRRIAKSK